MSAKRSAEQDRPPTAGEADERVAAIKSLFDLYHTMSIAAASGPADPWIAKVFFVEDDADGDAIMKRLESKSPMAGPFLRMAPWTAVRIHVDRLKLTDLMSRPPVTEFTFA